MIHIWQGKQNTLYKFNLKKKCVNCYHDHLTLFRPQKSHLGIINQPKECPGKLGFVFQYMNDSGKNLGVIVVFQKDTMASVKVSI